MRKATFALSISAAAAMTFAAGSAFAYDEIKPLKAGYDEIKPLKTAYDEIKPLKVGYDEIKPLRAA